MNHDFEISNGVLRKYQGKAEKVVIPDGVTEIGFNAFTHCTMSRVEIPEGVTKIARLAFLFCQNLTEVKLPNSLTTIENQAFCDCNHLGEMTFPDNITYVGDRIFEYCHIEEITIFGETFDTTEIPYEYDYNEIAEAFGFGEGEFTSLCEFVRFIAASEVPVLLLSGRFDDLYMPESIRCELIACALERQPTNRNFLNMVRKHITKIIGCLPEKPEIIRYLLKNEIFTSDTIDECISIAIKRNTHEMQAMLTEYKCRNRENTESART